MKVKIRDATNFCLKKDSTQTRKSDSVVQDNEVPGMINRNPYLHQYVQHAGVKLRQGSVKLPGPQIHPKYPHKMYYSPQVMSSYYPDLYINRVSPD